ncbi:hypothetical protein [Paenibacillus sp. 7541]|uniref:hypothetical protein n=1 Tax=Paenibacillus sp. 7541 TaxID=2026236 RepID=UPI000BA79CE3|nr:hypothetical protein [Paenibacillus sp. 7541]PAK48120.1 hypothetical protein CHH75_23245 [Paenibacillus sp. 7541]
MQKSHPVLESQKFEPEVTYFEKVLMFGSLMVAPLFLPIVLWRFFQQYHKNYARGHQYQLLGALLGGMYLFILMYAFLITFSGLDDDQRTQQIITLAWKLGIAFIVPAAILTMVQSHHNSQFYKLAKEYEKQFYKGIFALEAIAAEVKQPLSRVREDLEYLLEHKSFQNGIIKDGVVLLDNGPTLDQLGMNVKASDRDKTMPKVVSCSGCGAETIIETDQPVECEYCGSVLNTA